MWCGLDSTSAGDEYAHAAPGRGPALRFVSLTRAHPTSQALYSQVYHCRHSFEDILGQIREIVVIQCPVGGQFTPTQPRWEKSAALS